MNKTVFVNWGHAKQGKSEVVKHIAGLILFHNPDAITEPAHIDFSADINLVITIGNVKIGIESQGDPNSRMFKSLQNFAKANCDIIICSSRTSGATVNAVEDLKTNYKYEIVWLTNYRSKEKNQQSLNILSAKHIFELLQDTLTNKI